MAIKRSKAPSAESIVTGLLILLVIGGIIYLYSPGQRLSKALQKVLLKEGAPYLHLERVDYSMPDKLALKGMQIKAPLLGDGLAVPVERAEARLNLEALLAAQVQLNFDGDLLNGWLQGAVPVGTFGPLKGFLVNRPMKVKGSFYKVDLAELAGFWKRAEGFSGEASGDFEASLPSGRNQPTFMKVKLLVHGVSLPSFGFKGVLFPLNEEARMEGTFTYKTPRLTFENVEIYGSGYDLLADGTLRVDWENWALGHIDAKVELRLKEALKSAGALFDSVETRQIIGLLGRRRDFVPLYLRGNLSNPDVVVAGQGF